MIAKRVPIGSNGPKLLAYLYGPGKANEHANPHVIASSDVSGRINNGDQQRVTDYLEAQVALAPVDRPYVWHTSLRLAPGESLSDDQWAQVANDVMERTGIGPAGARWVAVRHDGDAGNHIHLAATLVSPEGKAVRYPFDKLRLGEACRSAELRYGLTITAPRDSTADRAPSWAEHDRNQQHQHNQAHSPTEPRRDRGWVRDQARQAAAHATDFDEYTGRLQAAGIEVHYRFSTQNVGEVTGYSVTLPDDGIRLSGSKLGRGLGLPDLQRSWDATKPDSHQQADAARSDPDAARSDPDAAGRRADQAPGLDEAIRDAAEHPSEAVADAAGQLLHTSARSTPQLQDAARTYQRARYQPRTFLETPQSVALRRAISAVRMLERQPSTLTAIIQLIGAVAQWHTANQRHHQAAAARAASQEISRATQTLRPDQQMAERIRAIRPDHLPPQPPPPTQGPTLSR